MPLISRRRRDAGAGLESTRLLFVSFDAEEAGLRGARAFARAHRSEIAGIATFAYNMDCLYRKDRLRFLLTDLNGSVGLDRPSTALLSEIAGAEGIRPQACR